MYFTGFADEAAPSIEGQIEATQRLGWHYIESRSIDGTNIHDLPQDQFEVVCEKLEAAGVGVNCFGSGIANWGQSVEAPFEDSLETARRAVDRMKRLGTKLIRIMSYQIQEDREPEDQMEEERFRRLRELTRLFLDAGIQPVHENCKTYGGMSWQYTLKMLENVPGLKLVYDTGNPVFDADFSKPKPYPRQSSWEFYEHVKEHIVYVHIKDATWDEANQAVSYTWPGEGDGDVREVLTDLFRNGYDGGLSIEPHMQKVFHDPSQDKAVGAEALMDGYVEYGWRLMKIVEEIKGSVGGARG